MTDHDSPKNLLCIIPARGGSKRFPKKNIALFSGKPLLAHTIETALKCEVFNMVCVSSEDANIRQIAARHGAHEVLDRPASLASDSAQVKDVCFWVLEHYLSLGKNFDAFAVLLPTSPLRAPADIRNAYQTMLDNKADGAMSVTPWPHPPQRALGVNQGKIFPFFGEQYMKQAQLLDPLYRHDGTVIFMKTEVFLREKTFFCKNMVPAFIPPERAVDVDSPMDLKWAEFVAGETQ